MRLIDADELIWRIPRDENSSIIAIKCAPTVIGKCALCKSSKVLWNNNELVWCKEHGCIMAFDSFCSEWDGGKND